MTDEDRKLNERQKIFVKEFLVDLNATQAAIRAGYSEDCAKEIGCNNIAKPHIYKAIQEAMAARSKRVEITADMVLTELGRIGFSNITNYMRWNENSVDVVPSDQLSDDAARCVSEVTQHISAEGGTVKVKLHDKVSALEKIGRHLGMFNDKLKLQGDVDNPLMFGGKIEIELVRPKENI